MFGEDHRRKGRARLIQRGEQGGALHGIQRLQAEPPREQAAFQGFLREWSGFLIWVGEKRVEWRRGASAG